MKKLLVVAVSAIVLSGCITSNQQGGTLIGAGVGGLLGSQIGSGTGKLVATGLGVLAGAMAGQAVGQHMDRPPTIVYRESTPQSNNQCGGIENDGVRSSCERGLADRRRELQKQSEQRAYQCSRYGKC
jgi:uncharacterized protein YcfJ